jgi:YHS domain-containing protein
MMRFGCGAHVMGHGHGKHASGSPQGPGNGAGPRWIPPASAIDPVCGMTVAPDKAKSSVHNGEVYYFCSPDCREKFEASPADFLKAGKSESQNMEHHHG